jgi:hypothetical protein
MKRILFFIAIATISLTSCQNPATDLGPTPTATSASTLTPVPVGDVPKSAKDLIATQYSGYNITEVEKEVSYWALVYKVHIRVGESGKTQIVLLFDANWKFTGEKK